MGKKNQKKKKKKGTKALGPYSFKTIFKNVMGEVLNIQIDKATLNNMGNPNCRYCLGQGHEPICEQPNGDKVIVICRCIGLM